MSRLVIGLLACFVASLALAVPVASAAPAPPDALSFTKELPMQDGSVDVEEVSVPGAEDTAKSTAVGSIANERGDIAEVTVKGGDVSIAPVDGYGKYEGSVNLAPSQAKGPKTKITLSVRDSVWWAMIVLAVGLLLALFGELWLTRGSPRRRLSMALGRLETRLAKTAAQTSKRLTVGKHTGWTAPLFNGAESLLAELTTRIKDGLSNAISEEERKRFGPEGTEMTKLDTLVASYEELLGYAAQISKRYATLLGRVGADSRTTLEDGALASRISELLRSNVISDAAELATLNSEAKDLHTVVLAIARLDENYRLLNNATSDNGIKVEIAKQRRQLLGNNASADDVESQHARYVELANKIYGEPQQQVVQIAVRTPPVALEEAAAALVPQPPGGEAAPAAPLPVVSTSSQGSFLSRNFDLANIVFIAASAVVVFVGGLAALYYDSSVFGSTGDYLAVLLWASTVQGGISLVRRVVPGGVSSLTSAGS